MGSEQLSASLTMDYESTEEEDFALADKISEEIQKIKGVKTVGAMRGNATMSLGGSGADKNYSFMVLLDEEFANQNKEIAAKMEKVFQDNKCEEYSVSDSNMDMSSMMGSGLQVNIYGKDIDKLIEISEDVMKMVEEVKGYEEPTNGQEEGDKEIMSA